MVLTRCCADCRADESHATARQEFDEMVWAVHGNGPKPGSKAAVDDDEDEDVVMDNSQALAPNVTCPLTLTAVRLERCK